MRPNMSPFGHLYADAYPGADISTEPGIKACTWLREISSYSCLTVLPGPAWLLLNKICIPFSRSRTHEHDVHHVQVS